MRNKYVDLMLFSILILLFISYFILLNQLKADNLMTNNLNNIERYVKKNKWGKAQESQKLLENNWKKFKFVILLNYGTEEYLTFHNNLDQIRAGIISKDKGLVLSSIKITRRLWHNFIKIVPEP